MRQFMLTAALIGSLVGLPALVGCDRTVSETKTEQKKADGTEVKTQDKTVQKSDGTVVHTEEKKIDK